MYQCLNGDILLRKCSIKTSAKWRNSANIPRQWSAIKEVNDLAKKKKLEFEIFVKLEIF